MYVLDLNALKNYKMTLKNWRSLPFPLLIVIAFLARVLLAAGARLGGRVLLGGAGAAGSLSGSDCSMQAGRLPLHKILLHSDMLHSAADDDDAVAQAGHLAAAPLAAAPLRIAHSLEAAVVVAMAPPHIAMIFLLSR